MDIEMRQTSLKYKRYNEIATIKSGTKPYFCRRKTEQSK